MPTELDADAGSGREKEMVELIIKGQPIAKKRPRFARRGKFVTTYNDQQTEEGRFLWEVRTQINGVKFDGPVDIDLYFMMPIPKSTSKKNKLKMKSGETKHTKKPDVDNLVKFVFDCLNGELWDDDTQVVSLVAKKEYSENPRTVIRIMEAA